MLFLKKFSGAGLCCVRTKSCRNLRIGSACIPGEQRWDSGRVFGKKLAPTEAWRRYLAIQEFQLYLQPVTDYLMESMFWSFMTPFPGKIMTLHKNLYTEIPWPIIRLWKRLFWHILSSGIGCTNAGNFLK